MKELDGLHPALRYHITNTLGWTQLRETQVDAIAPITSGKDVLLLSPTAGGKTEAAVFPLISRIAAEKSQGLSLLYICPLKALLNNLIPRLEQYAGFVGLSVGLWHGDVGLSAKKRILHNPPQVLLTTPESLEGMLISADPERLSFLATSRTVLVDELHAFAGDDRGWHLLFLMSRLERLCGQRLQRVGLTATVGNPHEVLEWFASGRRGQIVGPLQPVAEGDVTVDHVGSIPNAVTVISRLHRGERRLVFADSRARVEAIAAGLQETGVRTFVSHASVSVDERRRAEAAFATEPDCVIVATSTLELGLDVGDLDRVIQVGAPSTVSSFLQRMGRTGRRSGTTRNCLFLATDDYELLACIALTALWRSGNIEAVFAPTRPAHIFAQQVMGLVLQERGITKGDIPEWLGAAMDAVPSEDRELILAHMLEMGVLHDDDGIVGFGKIGEDTFGRRHFSDLVASFSEPLLLTVKYGSLELGQVHPASVAQDRGRPAAVISLGGKSWRVSDLDWKRRTVSVLPAEGGGRSRWLGAGRPMSNSVAKCIEQVVAGTPPACRLSRRAEAALEQAREALEFVDGHTLPFVASSDGKLTLWGFGGGAAMASIASALTDAGIPVSAFDDFSLRINDSNFRKVASAMRNLDPEAVHPRLPEAPTDALKFGLCLPESIARNVLELRTSDPASVAALCERPAKSVRMAG